MARTFLSPWWIRGGCRFELRRRWSIIRPLITEVFVWLMLLRAHGAATGTRLLLLPVVLWSLTDVYASCRSSFLLRFKVLWPDLPSCTCSATRSVRLVGGHAGLFSLVLIILRRTIRLSHEKRRPGGRGGCRRGVAVAADGAGFPTHAGVPGGNGVPAHAAGRR